MEFQIIKRGKEGRVKKLQWRKKKTDKWSTASLGSCSTQEANAVVAALRREQFTLDQFKHLPIEHQRVLSKHGFIPQPYEASLFAFGKKFGDVRDNTSHGSVIPKD